jgi:hypothetical protein
MKMNRKTFPRVKRRNTTDTISKYARSLIPALPPSSPGVGTNSPRGSTWVLTVGEYPQKWFQVI